MRFSTELARLATFATVWLGIVGASPSHYAKPDSDDTAWDGTLENIITRDVCVIGGGASGTYAAIRLRELGQSVALIEKEDHLGGHTRTYHDPETGTPIDYGVWVYENNTEATNFFAHFNVSLTVQDFTRVSEGSQRYDLRTGEPVAPPAGNITDAILRYTEQLLKYPYLAEGWDLPDPVPEDLLLSFRDFVAKYDLAAAVEVITLYVQGLNRNILDYPMVYIMKYFSLGVLQGIQKGFSTTETHDNQALYAAAQAELGEDVLLSSTAISIRREVVDPETGSEEQHHILVRTPTGVTLIKANKLLVTIPPILSNLEPFDLDDRERSIFAQFQHSFYYTTVLTLSGIPSDVQILNRGNDTEYNIPVLPGAYVFSPSSLPGTFMGFFGGGDQNLREEEVRGIVQDNALSLRNAGYDLETPDILAYANHSPFELFVFAEEIGNGFYRDLYSLQGYRGTWYSGAAFHAHSSAALWKFTESVLVDKVLSD
ncbi:hypothetical protein ASPVEDRAFT_140072 [Aspergillus versicolor CBS 583.65]|uniref:Amine oxidase domain-containing protein n=1 Tax=Aspergillus versicolor CBS 583.65 TaxID=1036611 RepID=A0A1L9PXY3_ASPVE|nr:uncharacterized protein ASPVEDRAFT_140072 [Aspergillus versicolor CBS 583.65]OJJ06292.1 hypothetical protein ASPVEDRAFT_140072 [Aspergillus versicolor CBS 583.65]